MNAEKRKAVVNTIIAIGNKIAEQMINEEKNRYDPEVQFEMELPEEEESEDKMEDETFIIKKSYRCINEDRKNRKRRENRPGVLEQCILDGKYEEVTERIRRSCYTAITAVSKMSQEYCDERTARKIIHEMFTMIGYRIEMIPCTVVDETIKCMKEWLFHNKTMYKYNRGEIRPLDMKQEEMLCTYNTYILTKKIILINSSSENEYNENIAKLDKKLKPVYAAIRALNAME